MSQVDYQKIRDNISTIQQLADAVAKDLQAAGKAQGGGSYLDRRCDQIKALAREIGVLTGANTP